MDSDFVLMMAMEKKKMLFTHPKQVPLFDEQPDGSLTVHSSQGE